MGIERQEHEDDVNERDAEIDKLRRVVAQQHARIAQLECAVEDAGHDGVLLDRIEKGQWSVAPIVGGGWEIERSVGSSLTDFSEERLAHHRGTLRDALYLATKATPAEHPRCVQCDNTGIMDGDRQCGACGSFARNCAELDATQ